MSSFPSVYEEFIYKRTYSRWLDDEKRRETWNETVNRYGDFFRERVPSFEESWMKEYNDAINAIVNFDVMPSMRCLWTAGPALKRENIAGYNCAYLTIDDQRAFSEMLYILMCGTGVGFSVERQYVVKLPEVPETIKEEILHKPIEFADSKKGWADGYKKFIDHLYRGIIPPVDLSKIREKGARLKTFGGRASGPEPLKDLLQFTANKFKEARGRKLNSLECHDICCKIANCVVVGGVRRSAGISVSNLTDDRMRHAKDGEFWLMNPQRGLANNSVAYTEKPEMARFMEEWISLMRSGNGERGIINREGLQKKALANGREPDEFGVNPCGEIILRPQEFCNLTEIIVRANDTLDTLKLKAKYATILGTLQSTLTDFNFLRKAWKDNCEEERLLGVSMTGTCDHPVLQNDSSDARFWLSEIRKVTRLTADEWADILGISKPKSVTCVKPSGTVSQLVNCSSGLHPRYSSFYIRRVRVTATDPLAKFLIHHNVMCQPEVGETWSKHTTLVFDFPVKGPETGSIERNDRTAIEQLEYWKMFANFWCDHNPSVTIYVKEHEWMEVGAWVYKYWDSVGGLSFLPHDGGVYPLAPYEEITEEKYNELFAAFPKFDFNDLNEFENNDQTQGSQEYACAGGACELR